MEKIALNATHEVELYANTELEEFDVQLFLKKDGVYFAFDLAKSKDSDSTFTFKIPDTLGPLLKGPVDYSIYVYIDNARFKADDGKLEIISKDSFSGAKVSGVEKQEDLKFNIKVKASDEETPKETKKAEPKKAEPKKPEPTKPKSTPEPTKKPEPKKETPEPTKKPEPKKEVKEAAPAVTPREPAKPNSIRYYMEQKERRLAREKDSDAINARVRKILEDFNGK